ncbi:hypothetical protein R6Q57_016006, partial [Mikania cordata]
MYSYNAFIVGALALANLTQDNLEHINTVDVDVMDIAWKMATSDEVQELEMTLNHAFMTEVDDKRNEVRGRKSTGLGYSEVEPPFNNNYSSMPKINTYVDDLLLKSHRGHEFTTEQTKNAYKDHSTIIGENGSKLNSNCKPYVPSGSLEQVSTSSSSSQSDCDVKPLDPKVFYQK